MAGKCPRCGYETLDEAREKSTFTVVCLNPQCHYKQTRYIDAAGAYNASQTRITEKRLPPRGWVHRDVWGRGTSWHPTGEETERPPNRYSPRRKPKPPVQRNIPKPSGRPQAGNPKRIKPVGRTALAPGSYQEYKRIRNSDKKQALAYLLTQKLTDKPTLTREYLIAEHLYQDANYDEALRRIELCEHHLREARNPQLILELKAKIERALQKASWEQL